MKSTYKGYELRLGVEDFAHKLCKSLTLPNIAIKWVAWTTTAGINNHGEMVLADIADDATVSRWVFEKYCGFVAHELCHHKYTDFNARHSIQYVDQLHNAVEDAWIEHNAIRLNMTGNIEALFTTLIEGMTAEALDTVSNWTAPEQYPFVLAVYLRNHAKTKIPLAEGLEPIFEQAKVMLETCKSSYDTLKVAIWVYSQLKQVNKQTAQKPSKQAEKPDNQDGQGQGQGKAQTPAQGDSKDDAEGDADGQADGEGKAQADGQGKPQGKPQGVGKAQAPNDNTDAVEVEPRNEAPTGKGGSGTYSKEHFLQVSEYFVKNTPDFDVKVNVPAKLRYTVKRLFDNSGIEEFQRNRKSGSINVHALPKLGFTDRLFKRRLETDGIDSAVVICLDVSDSMFTDEADAARMRNAVKTCYALLETMSKAGVATCVLAFGRSTTVLKPWNMPLPKIADLLGRVKTKGCTNDYFAVKYAHELLLRRPEERKICFSITDGVGDGSSVYKQCQSGERLGITTIGVGIGLDVSPAYPQNVCVRDTADLGTTSFNKIKLAA